MDKIKTNGKVLRISFWVTYFFLIVFETHAVKIFTIIWDSLGGARSDPYLSAPRALLILIILLLPAMYWITLKVKNHEPHAVETFLIIISPVFFLASILF